MIMAKTASHQLLHITYHLQRIQENRLNKVKGYFFTAAAKASVSFFIAATASAMAFFTVPELV